MSYDQPFMKNTKQIRQGDILVRHVTTKQPIADEAPRENGRVILAHGEVTGHAHAIAASKVRKSKERTEQRNGPVVVSDLEIAEALAELSHDEHAPAKLQRGHYEVIRQREYTPAAIRNVAD